jgi:hypothetical protein
MKKATCKICGFPIVPIGPKDNYRNWGNNGHHWGGCTHVLLREVRALRKAVRDLIAAWTEHYTPVGDCLTQSQILARGKIVNRPCVKRAMKEAK